MGVDSTVEGGHLELRVLTQILSSRSFLLMILAVWKLSIVCILMVYGLPTHTWLNVVLVVVSNPTQEAHMESHIMWISLLAINIKGTQNR